MIDWGASGRRDSYEYALVDPFTLQETGMRVEALSGSGSITYALDSDNYSSATLHLAEECPTNRLIRVKHVVTLADGTQHMEVLGTFFADWQDTQSTNRSSDVSVSCYSALIRYTDSHLVRDLVRNAGDRVVQEVSDLIADGGGKVRFGTGVDMEQKHTVPVWFAAGTVCSDVLNTIAGWTGCEMGVDDNGYVTWDKYAPDAQKAVKHQFIAGRNCIYLPGYTQSDNGAETYNRVVAEFSRQSKQDGDPYPLADSASVDLPDSHPYGYGRIGRRKDYHLEVSDPCSHEQLLAQAERYLYQHCGGNDYFTIEHVGIPGLRAGDHVWWAGTQVASEGSYYDCIVEEISMELGPGCMCKTKLRSFGYGMQYGHGREENAD